MPDVMVTTATRNEAIVQTQKLGDTLDGTMAIVSLFTVPPQDGIAAAGTTQATATQLTQMINRVTTVGASSGVRLMPSQAGLAITVVHVAITNALPSGLPAVRASILVSADDIGAAIQLIRTTN